MRALAEMRQSYAALGWHLWRCSERPLSGPPVTTYYATTATGRTGKGETLWADTPLGVLRKVADHPSKRSS